MLGVRGSFLIRALVALALNCAAAQLFSTDAFALDPGSYNPRVRDLGLWIIRSADPSSLHPASPIGGMPIEVPEGFAIPLTYGFSASYGFSQFRPSPVVSDTLQTLLPPGAPVPEIYRLNRFWGGLGISRRTTLGAHFLDYPAFGSWGGGLSVDHVFTDYKPLFLCGRMTASYVGGKELWSYRGMLGELQMGLHFTGFDIYGGIGTRLAQLRLTINDDPVNSVQNVNPFQGDSWETHAGTEIFLTKYFAIGGGYHWHPDGKGFGVKLIYKSRGTSPLIDNYITPRRE